MCLEASESLLEVFGMCLEAFLAVVSDCLFCFEFVLLWFEVCFILKWLFLS